MEEIFTYSWVGVLAGNSLVGTGGFQGTCRTCLSDLNRGKLTWLGRMKYLKIYFLFFVVMTCSLSNLSALSRILRPQRLICGDPHCGKSGSSPAFYHRSQSYEAMFQHFVPQRNNFISKNCLVITLVPFFSGGLSFRFFVGGKGWWWNMRRKSLSLNYQQLMVL